VNAPVGRWTGSGAPCATSRPLPRTCRPARLACAPVSGHRPTTPGGRLFLHMLAAIAQVVDAAMREGYRGILDRADIGLSALRLNALWNMATVDLMAKGRPALGRR